MAAGTRQIDSVLGPTSPSGGGSAYIEASVGRPASEQRAFIVTNAARASGRARPKRAGRDRTRPQSAVRGDRSVTTLHGRAIDSVRRSGARASWIACFAPRTSGTCSSAASASPTSCEALLPALPNSSRKRIGVTAYRVLCARPLARVGAQREPFAGARTWVLPNPSGLNPDQLGAAYARRRSREGSWSTRARAITLRRLHFCLPGRAARARWKEIQQGCNAGVARTRGSGLYVPRRPGNGGIHARCGRVAG